MAVIGVSKPYVAVYSAAEDGVISYTKGALLAKAVQFSAEVSGGDNNDFYADNGVAESGKTFSNGTMTITADDLTTEGSSLILGITPSKVTVNTKEVDELVYNDDMTSPYLGFGCIIKKKRAGTTKWRAVVFPKVQFDIPPDAATTQGETIEWQASELSATIMRDDSEKHNWKREATFSTEADAEAYIKQTFKITGGAA